MPPWDDEPFTDFVPRTSRGPENSTPIIHPSTMAPLLLWSRQFLELADDIAAADQRWRDLLQSGPANQGTRLGRAAAMILVDEWVTSNATVPAVEWKGRVLPDYRYLAAVHGTFHPEDLSRAVKLVGQGLNLDLTAPTPIDTQITATIDGRRWCNAIDYKDLRDLNHAVAGAAMVIVAYLTGMRPTEVLALRPGCIERQRCGPTIEKYSVQGRKYKRVRRNGRSDPDGSARSWATILPVAQAVHTLERIYPNHSVLFPKARSESEAMDASKAPMRIGVLISLANRLTQDLGLPQAYNIPADPAGPISLRRFRRTLAWHIRRLPNGKVALAIQYGHLTTAQGEGYSGLTDSGFAALMADEEASALADSIEQARHDLEKGRGVSGPASQRLINVIERTQRFAGTYLSVKELRALKDAAGVTLYDNPNQFITCMFDPNRALCHRTTGGNVAKPQLDNCQTNCANVVRTGRQIEEMEHEVRRLRSEASTPSTPKPLASRLNQRADHFADLIEIHYSTAIIAPEEETDAQE